MLEWSVLLLGLGLLAIQVCRLAIEYRTYQKPEKIDTPTQLVIERPKDSKDAKAVDDWILRQWAIEEWEVEMKKHPIGSPKRKAYEDRLRSFGKYADQHQAKAR